MPLGRCCVSCKTILIFNALQFTKSLIVYNNEGFINRKEFRRTEKNPRFVPIIQRGIPCFG
jgi:hypothetical protein